MTTAPKEVFLASLQCPGMAWLLRTSEQVEERSEAVKLRMDEGREIGKKARGVYGGGAFVRPGPGSAATQRTRELLDEGTHDLLYEAEFEADGLIARADILRRTDHGWDVLEVKSGTQDKVEYVEDLAYTVMVARKAGLPVTGAALVLVSKSFRLGMPDEGLFVEVDCTGPVEELLPAFDEYWHEVSHLVLGDDRPDPEFSFSCRKCQAYGKSCLDEGIEDPLFDIPRLSEKKFEQLRELGVNRITEIPEDFKLTENQERVRQATVSGEAWVSPNLHTALEQQVKWPAYYLDFETMKTAYPLFSGVAPHEQLPTQYSIHIYADTETEVDHREFLADHATDDRRRLAEQLLKDLGETGSIVVYSSFEKRIMSYLAGLFPDLAEQLERCNSRLLDLEKIIKDNFYHPEFRGRSSIKRTLPALTNGDEYEDLPINNGDDASALFGRMARGDKTEKPYDEVRTNLLKYCKQDTQAMVDVHRALVAYAKQE